MGRRELKDEEMEINVECEPTDLKRNLVLQILKCLIDRHYYFQFFTREQRKEISKNMYRENKKNFPLF